MKDRFRIATLLMALALGWFAIATIFAATLTPKTRGFSQDLAMPGSISYDWLADFAAAGAPWEATYSPALPWRAAAALKPDKAAVSPETIATRERALAAARHVAAISDDELKSLARSDMRLILTRRPDLKPAITSAYRRGSSEGKAYIDEVAQSVDPAFAASSLR
jgi:hypothetical protein